MCLLYLLCVCVRCECKCAIHRNYRSVPSQAHTHTHQKHYPTFMIIISCYYIRDNLRCCSYYGYCWLFRSVCIVFVFIFHLCCVFLWWCGGYRIWRLSHFIHTCRVYTYLQFYSRQSTFIVCILSSLKMYSDTCQLPNMPMHAACAVKRLWLYDAGCIAVAVSVRIKCGYARITSPPSSSYFIIFIYIWCECVSCSDRVVSVCVYCVPVPWTFDLV